MEHLGVHIDDKLNFNEHINKMCKSAGNQLNALIRLKSFLGLKEKEVLVNKEEVLLSACMDPLTQKISR